MKGTKKYINIKKGVCNLHALRVFHSRSSILRVNYTILVDVFVRPGPGREFGF